MRCSFHENASLAVHWRGHWPWRGLEGAATRRPQVKGRTPPETLQNENAQPKKAIHPPLSHHSHGQRITGSWKLLLSTWVGFILCKTSQCSNQTFSRNKKSICFAILAPPLRPSHYIKKSKHLFIAAFQSSSIIQSTLRSFTQWNGFYRAITHITWMQNRACFPWMPRVVWVVYGRRKKRGFYVLLAVWRVWKPSIMERNVKDIKLG